MPATTVRTERPGMTMQSLPGDIPRDNAGYFRGGFTAEDTSMSPAFGGDAWRREPAVRPRRATHQGCGAMPSVISILVPHGSAMNATRIVLTKLLGVSPWVMVTPSASIRLRNSGRFFTSKPM